jgi:hypothetical protein
MRNFSPSYLYAIYTDNLVVVKSVNSFVLEKQTKNTDEKVLLFIPFYYFLSPSNKRSCTVQGYNQDYRF